jgi:hypothetical protein
MLPSAGQAYASTRLGDLLDRPAAAYLLDHIGSLLVMFSLPAGLGMSSPCATATSTAHEVSA